MSQEITVTKLPKLPSHYKRSYPFAELDEVNKGFFVPDKKKRAGLAAAACKYAKAKGIKLVTRSYAENGIEGILCVRIK